MAFLDSFFKNNVVYKMKIYTCTQTKTNGVLSAKTFTLSKTVDEVLFWKGSFSRSNVSEKYKADVVGYILCKPESVALTDFNPNNKITIETSSGSVVATFSAIFPDDIAGQGEVVQVAVKEFVN